MLGPSASGRRQFGRRLCRMIASQRYLRRRSVSFVVSFIHVHQRRSAFTTRSLTRQGYHHVPHCTVILNPEKRKVGGSTPPLTTAGHSEQR